LEIRCPFCKNDREDLIEKVSEYKPFELDKGKKVRIITYLCVVCSREFDIDHETE